MNKTALNTLLNSIGKRTFVMYFEEFGDSGLSNQDLIALLQSVGSFAADASANKTSNARRIFREGAEAQALSIIAESRRVGQKVAEDARALLAQRRYSKPPASSALLRTQHSMSIIRTIKLAIQKAAKERKKMATFHSQVLLYADLLKHLNPAEFCRDVGVPAAYHIEFRKMIAVAHTLSELGYSIQKN